MQKIKWKIKIRRCIVCLFTLTFTSCGEGCKITSENLNEIIVVIKNPTKNQNLDSFIINDNKRIKKISSLMSRNVKQPIKFIPKYRLEFHYSSDTIVYLVKGKFLNIKGYTYLMFNDFDEILKNASCLLQQ